MVVTEQRPSRSDKGAQTQARIIAQARGVLVSDGYDAVVMRAVADAVGIKLGNLQYYFPTRDHLLLAVMAAEASSDIDDIRAIAKSGLPPREALASLVNELVSKWRSDSGVVFAALGFLRTHKPDFEVAYRNTYAAFYREIEGAIEHAIPGLAPEEYRRRARLLTALIDGAAAQIDVGPRADYLDTVADLAVKIALTP